MSKFVMSYNIKQCGIIILAAGSSSRMGKPKQLLEFDGMTLITHVSKIACQSKLYPVIAVLGANVDLIQANLDVPGLDIVINENWKEGMASSLLKGLNSMNEMYPHVDGVIILVGDQPHINNQHIDQLIDSQNKSGLPISACSYAGIMGTPALFHKTVFPELMLLKGDIGAKKIIKKRKQDVATVFFDKGVVDIDTLEDYENLINEKK
ncbi:nucleotidyltransferase family protein [Flavobacterium gawalongense]|uniref:nucleotidyltransferase family protein n=1 Tax=Flavobacterium gawalongense TaxID=2594432 RepID=UPI001F28E603|nr:nucleotidyltransferase family protein [Flavobacterium gawalongense]